MQRNRWDDVKFHIITVLGLFLFIFAIYVTTNVKLESKYEQAVDMIKNKNWDAAEHYLAQASNYKDVEVLKRYVWAKLELEYKSQQELNQDYYEDVYDYLQQIPNNYQGALKKDIFNLRNDIMHKRQKLCQNSSESSEYQANSNIEIVSMGNRYVVVEREAIAPLFSSEDLSY
ncbi:MAG: hypothetical protein FH758_08760 [Firmicutes bacterium]|nr:hypothetical protein [Bacillota bacterium]